MVQEERLVGLYRDMLTIRRFEERLIELHADGKLVGSIHLCIGQEAVAVGVCSALRTDDYITSTHRGHGHCIAKGADMRLMMAELMGKATGYCKGKGGSMHIADIGFGHLGANGIVGGGFAIAVGAATAIQYKNRDQVVACFFGDGAANMGVFHESLNLASLWKLPVVFVCENNGYGVSTPVEKASANPDIYKRADAYNMPGVRVDGMDVVEIEEKAAEAVERARNGKGPTLIECLTYRYTGHSRSDPGVYRTKEEVETWKKRCPVLRLRGGLIESGVSTEDELDRLDQEVLRQIEKAVQFAEESPYPTEEDLETDVYTPQVAL